MFDEIRNFNRQEPVNELLKLNVDSLCKRMYHSVAVKEMEALSKAMVAHDDYDINNYRIVSKDTSDESLGRWSIDIFVEYIPTENIKDEENETNAD